MTWQQTARWIIAAVGVSGAIAIVVYSRHRQTPPPRPPELERLDPTIKTLGGAGQKLIYRKGQSTITINYGNVSETEDGRGRLGDVVIEGLEESHYTVTAKVLQMGKAADGSDHPEKLDLSGGVKLNTDDGLEVTSQTATWYDKTGQLAMPGNVNFKKGRVSGSGMGALYEQARDAFRLLDQAKAHVDADAAGKGAMDLTSLRMTLIRGQHVVQLEDNAKIVGDTQTLSGKNGTLTFTEDEKAVKYLELRGTARVTPNPGATATDRPAMSADNITMSFYEDGITLQHATLTGQGVLTMTGETTRTVRGSRIDLSTAPDGQTLTDLQAHDRVNVTLAPTATTPGRTITSNSLSAKGDPNKGLTSARFDGNPVFEESELAPPARGASAAAPAKPARRGTADVLVLALGGQLDAIERADFQGNAEFHDGDTVGKADVAQYEEASGWLHLLPNVQPPRRVSHVETPDMTVDAVTIDVDTSSDDFKAKGSVRTHSKPAPGTAPQPAALFSGDDPIIGSAETLEFTNKTSTAIYTGTPQAQARLKQGDSAVSADRIEYTDTTRNLKATGKVDSNWLFDSEPDASGKKEPPKQERVRADTLAYDESTRTAVYKGAQVRVTTTDGTEVVGQTVTFRLADTSRTLQSMRAQTDVWATLSGGYEAAGDVLTYDATPDIYTLEGRNGQAAQVKSPKSDSPASNPQCSLNTGMRLRLDRKTGIVTVPGEGLAPRTGEQVPCSMSLRHSK